jgi:hypothetical protein
MKRFVLSACVLAFLCGVPPAARAQMGMDLFKRPSLVKVFNPVIGKGAEYQTTNASDKSKVHTMQMGTVGRESVEGKDGYWLEFSFSDSSNRVMVGKMLFTKDDFQTHKMIFQMPGQPAMTMPYSAKDTTRDKIETEMNDWHTAGSETITVPAGTFSCEHWRNDKKNSDIWTSDKVSPFGMVKEVSPSSSMVLTKVLSDYPERITGPVTQFDPQAMREQMMQQRQQNKP